MNGYLVAEIFQNALTKNSPRIAELILLRTLNQDRLCKYYSSMSLEM